MKLHKILNMLVNIIFPAKCLYCDQNTDINALLCSECWNDLKFCNKHNICKTCATSLGHGLSFESDINCTRCHNILPYFDKVLAPFEYDSLARELIHSYKFNDRSSLAEFFAPFIIVEIEKYILEYNVNFDLISYVPINFMKLLKRKYNQSAIQAMTISRRLGIPCRSILKKQFFSLKAQSNCKTISEREKNIKNSIYLANDTVIKNKNILLIDDVISSGSTVNEIAKILKVAGANKVVVATIARNHLDIQKN